MTTQEPVIVIDNFHKSYGKAQAIKGISMRVEQGEIFGFLGPNGAGKTIFMSSHIMSDVEKVCQRVAVIRQGEIVTIEEVEKLRQKAGQRVRVEFGDAVSADDLARMPGVSNVTRHNSAYHFNVSGSMDALIKALSRHEVLRLQAEEAPLEEVFFLSLTTALSVWLATLVVKNAGIDWGWLAIAELIEFALMFLASGIGMLFGSFMNGSRAAGGAALGIIALAYLMNTLGTLSDNLSWMLKIQPLYYIQGIQALAEHSITGWYPLVPVIGGLICGIAGLVIFNRRDLPTT